MRFDLLDYPTAWEIQRAGLEHTDPRCSAAQTNGMFLCDCGAVVAEWHRLKGLTERPGTNPSVRVRERPGPTAEDQRNHGLSPQPPAADSGEEEE